MTSTGSPSGTVAGLLQSGHQYGLKEKDTGITICQFGGEIEATLSAKEGKSRGGDLGED